MIPVALVTGFLGSGKTTLLKRLVKRYAERRVAFLVNEFSSVDIDAALVGHGDHVIAVPGGSIFCTCLVTEFIGRLQELKDRFDTPDSPLEGVIIEASGMADPSVIDRMLNETGMDQHYRLCNVTSLVDPGTFSKLLHTLPNIRNQIAASDLILVNRMDLHSESAMDTTEQAAREINPNATLRRVTHADAPDDLLALKRLKIAGGDYAGCRDPRYHSRVVTPTCKLSVANVESILTALGDSLYRAKGYLSHENQWHYVEMAGGIFSTSPATPPRPPNGETSASPHLVLIGAGADTKAIDMAAESLTAPTVTI
jgi:G3E family GTPase